jgi:hypothetical protein
MAQIANCEYVRKVINANGGNMGACSKPSQMANMEYVGTAFNNNFGAGTVPSQYMTKRIADTAAVKGCLASLKNILLASPYDNTWLSKGGKATGKNTTMPSGVSGIYKDTVNGRAVALYVDDASTGKQYQFRATTDAGLSWQEPVYWDGGTGKFGKLVRGVGFTPNMTKKTWFASLGAVYTIEDIFSGDSEKYLPKTHWNTPESWTPSGKSYEGFVASNDSDIAAWISPKYFYIVGVDKSTYGALDNQFQEICSVSVGSWYGTTRVMAVGSDLNGHALAQVFNTDGTIYVSIGDSSKRGDWGGFLGAIPCFIFSKRTPEFDYSYYRMSSTGSVSLIGSVYNAGIFVSHNSVPSSSGGLLVAISGTMTDFDGSGVRYWNLSNSEPEWLCRMK